MDAFLQKFQHLRIPLEEITSATENFNDEKNRIGVGGFGKVYKGEVSHSQGRSVVAIKRLDDTHGQGTPEFLKEITMLSDYRHENLISLLGFCCEAREMILVYEHASRGSLDRHLNSPHLTWTQRLKICIDAAKGLSYLHGPRGTHRRLIHCDIKSSNILLDDQWNAKISDLGLSIIGSANEQHSVIVTLAAGTAGYIDPLYRMTHTLTKESDVYSFGVVLLEVLCGRLCYTHVNGHVQHLVPTWIESYKKKKLDDIIFKNKTIQPLDQGALEIFSDVAYRCLNESREDRPTMADVVMELEIALYNQEFSEGIPLLDYEEMTKSAKPPLNYRSKDEMMELLTKGILLNHGKTWFSVNNKGEHYEMISIAECLDSSSIEFDRWSSDYDSRFAVGTYHCKGNLMVNIRVKTQFLSPRITYTVNLVFKRTNIKGRKDSPCRVSFKCKLPGETIPSISHLAVLREDGWWTCELYQITSDERIAFLEFLFDGLVIPGIEEESIAVEGIEFRPVEKVENKEEKQPIADSDANWEEKLPADYKDIMKWSKRWMLWKKKEVYTLFCEGFLIHNGKKGSIWFSLDKNGKKCHMLSPSALTNSELVSFPESRFGEAIHCTFGQLHITFEIQSQMVSSEATYACYLVYKLPKNQSGWEAPLELQGSVYGGEFYRLYFCLVSPQTPVITPKAVIRPKANIRPMVDQSTRNRTNMLKIKDLPRHRNDGWSEVQIWEFRTATTTNMIPVGFTFHCRGQRNLEGLIIEGIEFRPI